ncbi:MAG: hypothetical protein QXN55_03440 [Candidatus Nitrosotenuis sp.]|jgi:hypothetical protein
MNSQILEKVESSGVCGIKKAELKKLFGADCETSLDELAKEEKIIVDNKGVAHYVWSKDNYLSHISQNDPKFKILSKLVKNLESKICQLQAPKTQDTAVDFKIHFDKSISEISSSLGWVPLAEIRAKVCQSLGITQEKFYSEVSSLIEANQSEYEISTGGQEGIHVRGMLHGYIRRL